MYPNMYRLIMLNFINIDNLLLFMTLVEEVKNFVENECKKPSSKYGYEPFTCHFIPMVDYAEKLCDELGGDKELILIAAWLHDIGSIIHGRKDHHITGSEIAEEFLQQHNYPKDKIELVKKCIFHHRGSQNLERYSIEEKIVAEADVLSNFDNIAGIFKAAFVFENLSQDHARIAVRDKLRRKFNQLHFDSSKELIKPKFDAAMLILQ